VRVGSATFAFATANKKSEDSAEIAERIGQQKLPFFPGTGVGFEPNPREELQEE